MSQKRSRQDFEADARKQHAPYVVYGTPLPPLDDSTRDDGSYVPVWKQEVVDERGRKRLHGAFTGGFSAGYFNTVGSKDGWAPSTFVSSRTKRAQNTAQAKPEDFMDEEDIRENEESKHLFVTEGMEGFGTADDPSQRNSLMDLFRPPEDSIGKKLLKCMGWEEGQPIGQAALKGASSQVDVLDLPTKSDTRGIGYDATATSSSSRRKTVAAGISEDEADARPGLAFAGAPRANRPPKSTSIGVGPLNDTGSDDEDPYAVGPRISLNKAIDGDKKPKKRDKKASIQANPTLKTNPVLLTKKAHGALSSLRKCHDGRLPLTGFVLADTLDEFGSMSLSDGQFKPLEVPDDWTPSRVTPQESELPPTNTDNMRQQHNPQTRGAALGEQKLPTKSVFDFMSSATRERLAAVTGRQDLPAAGNQTSATETAAPEDIDLPWLDPSIAKTALTKGFMPYSDDLDKRACYKAFLEYSASPASDGAQQANNEAAPKPTPTPRQSKEDFLNEINEFLRAAQVFKPVTGLMASRFTSSTTALDSAAGTGKGPDNQDLLISTPRKPLDPAEEAAKMGMFGPATRIVTSFMPNRLVCKRFGVEMPPAGGL